MTIPSPAALRRIGALDATMAALAVVGALMLPVPQLSSGALVGGLLLALAFLVVESFHVEVRIGSSTEAFSLSELPLVTGLLLLDPLTVVVARVVGSAIAFGPVKRQPWYKLAFNVALMAVETLLVHALFTVLRVDTSASGLQVAVAIAGLALLADVLGMLALAAAASAMEGRVRHDLVAPRVGATVAPALATASFGYLTARLLALDPVLAWAPIVVGIVLHRAHQSHLELAESNQMTERVLAFTREVGAAGSASEVAHEAAVRARSVIDARVAAVRVGDDRSTWQVDPPALAPAELEALAALGPGRFSDDDPRLRATGVRALLATDLPDGGMLLFLDAHDVRGFREADSSRAAMLANHTGVALDKAARGEALLQEMADAAHQATHDALTGLANRVHLRAVLEERLLAGTATAILLCDLDRFKEINDVLGHDVGDELLAAVAERFARELPDGALLARLGGDEFAVLVELDRPADAARAAHRLRGALDGPIRVGELGLEIDTSIGVAVSAHGEHDPDSLLRQADIAMYAAKRQGTNVEVFRGIDDAAALRGLRVSHDLRSGIDQGQITLAFQPVVDVDSGLVVGAEALARWEHAALGSVSPAEFVPAAEQAGLINALTDHVLSLALRQARAWREAGMDLMVAVNLSARSLVDATLPERVAEALLVNDVEPGKLTLELTESSVLSDPQRTIPVLQAIADLGVRVSLDDFGTGYSSLSYLQTLPVHEVKIDRSFVMPLLVDENAVPLVSAMVRLAHDLNLEVVAEGVEAANVLRLLELLGCDRVQGYHVAKPLPPDEFTAWFNAVAQRLPS